jgi:hypothetical protein
METEVFAMISIGLASAELTVAARGATLAHSMGDKGIVRIRSKYAMEKTSARIRAAIAWIAQPDGITHGAGQFAAATAVVESITSTAKAR